jgi:hypothetical protein
MSKQSPSDDAHNGLTDALFEIVAERSVLRTLYRYAHSIDYGLEVDWLDCFMDDGVFDIRRRVDGKPNRRYEGRNALARFIAAHTRAPDNWHKHLLIEPVVTIEGDRATVDSYFVRVDADNAGVPILHAFGRYRDSLVKDADGMWRFTLRIAEVESMRVTPSD